MCWDGGHIATTKLLRFMADDIKIESGLTFPRLQNHFMVSGGLRVNVVPFNACKFVVFHTTGDVDHPTLQDHYEAASFRCEESKGFIRLFSVWKHDQRLAQMAIKRSVIVLFCHRW